MPISSVNISGGQTMPLDLLIACRVHLFAEGVKKILEDLDDVRILGIAGNVDNLWVMIKYEPDIIVADYEFCDQIFTSSSDLGKTKVLLINDNPNNALGFRGLQEMVSRGLAGIIPKDSNSSLLKKAISKLNSGELWIDHRTISDVLFSQDDKKSTIKLTKKETAVLKLICAGYSNKKIAQKMSVSEQTVKSHCNHLFKKFGVSNRLKLALCASKEPQFLNNLN